VLANRVFRRLILGFAAIELAPQATAGRRLRRVPARRLLLADTYSAACSSAPSRPPGSPVC
jgi:hypothetical protein